MFSGFDLPQPKQPVPVFPLPDVVLFPRITLPLHVFELRYRTMVREALSGDRLIALALLEAGWEQDYYGSPPFHEIGCLARFDEVEWRPDDCYDLRVTGVARARFTRIVREYPYRTARIEVLPQDPLPEDDPILVLEKRALADVMDRALARAGASEQAAARIDRDQPYEALVNLMSMGALLPLTAAERLELLAMDSIFERGRQVRELAERALRQPERGEAPESGERN